MKSSHDGLLRADQVADLSSIIFRPSSWTILNVPVKSAEAKAVFQNLWNSPVNSHLLLCLTRHRRKDRFAAISNISHASSWAFLDTVSIWYEKASSCSNNGFLPVSEPGYLFYKGNQPDTKNTAWFSAGTSNNATNLWNLATQAKEGDKTYFQRFSWELNLLLLSLSQPLETNRFNLITSCDSKDLELIFGFINTYAVGCNLYVETQSEADEIISKYELYVKGTKK